MASLPIPRHYRTVVYIPSRTDGCMLEVCLSIPTAVSSQPQAHTGVVIAHPYGPLGGSYNNNVVGALLQWFESSSLQAMSEGISSPSSSSLTSSKSTSGKSKRNSTGADSKASKAEPASPTRKKSQRCGRSKGRTSWFGEGEREDYQTIVEFLQSGSHPRGERVTGGSKTSGWSGKIYDETGREIDPPRLPFLSRFVLCGFSYGGMIASTIPPPLRNPSDPSSGHLPTSYVLVSYPAGVAWFLTSGMQGSFYKRARAIIGQDPGLMQSSTSSSSSRTEAGTGEHPAVKAYFITGSQDQFTSSKTLVAWLKSNAGIDPPKQLSNSTSWSLKRPDGAVHLDVVGNVDHFWLDREHELLDRLQRWWSEAHPTTPTTASFQ
ncbi:hypothetical protein BGX31_001622 [Mortierella sp. GBA43]|nr:hypothetical protein BGX31_001622 [Mortierella sp. GBA43]